MESTFGTTGKVVAIVPIGALIMLILLYTLSSTADDYLSPSLEYLTVKLRIPESLSGVTLLAFGNGAPDVFSAISANGDDPATASPDDMLLSICSLVGATCFISSVVIIFTIRAAKDKKIKLTPKFFLRDFIFYTITLTYLLIVLLAVKEFNIYIAIGFLVNYALYVILVFK